MTSLLHTIKTKGIVNTLRRTGMIYRRLSFGRYLRSLNTMVNVLESYEAKATLPITAITLQRHAKELETYISSDLLEWAMHGYVHVDYTALSPEVVDEHLKKGIEIFNEAGIEVQGFRAPYLRVNEGVLSALEKAGFRYDSSKSYYLDLVPSERRDVRLILDYYKPMRTWKMEKNGGITEIPVCLPDDEIMVDRLKYRAEKVGSVWVDMCRRVIEEGGVPVIQLHPERGQICAPALEKVLKWASNHDIKSLHLKDVAALKKSTHAIVVTGDVDVVNISDFRYMQESNL